MAHDTPTGNTSRRVDAVPTRRVSTQTKAAYKTTELVAYVLAVLAALVASAMVDETGR